MNPHERLRKAVDKLKGHHIYVVPFYREDGLEASVQIQDKVNGVLQEPFVLNLEVDEGGLRIQRSKLKWKDQKHLLPGVVAYKKAMKKAIAEAPELRDKFTVMPHPSNHPDDFFLYAEAQQFPERRVWSVCEGDTGKQLWANAGYRVVNRIGYIITLEEWTEEDEKIDYKW